MKIISQQNLKSVTLISVPNTAYVNIVLLYIQINSSCDMNHGRQTQGNPKIGPSGPGVLKLRTFELQVILALRLF